MACWSLCARLALVLCIVSNSAGAQLSNSQPERERVYILADSLDWILAFHTLPEDRTARCELTTRRHPGAQLVQYWGPSRSFTISLMSTTATLDSFELQLDERQTITRQPSDEERRHNVLRLRGGSSHFLFGAKRLRVRAAYRADGSNARRERQDLEFDLTGFNALYWRVINLDCRPPRLTR